MNPESPTVYLIPCLLHEEAPNTVPLYILDAVRDCQAFFVENERSARRFLKSMWREMVIDDYIWVPIHKMEEAVKAEFTHLLFSKKNIGIISEAGCPGIADPGQILVSAAHEAGAIVKPLVGPNAILLALMASGLNGQHFHFSGYLPIGNSERTKELKRLENESSRKQCTKVFIETPYRNNQLLESIVHALHDDTRLCIAVDITAPQESIRTQTVGEWKKELPDLHKRPAIFCLLGPRVPIVNKP